MSALLANLAFGQPLALAALVLLPVIWWLLRFTPPRPRRINFPAIRLLFGLASKDETPHKSPWWLTALRTLVATLIIAALAEPVFNPGRLLSLTGGPVVMIVDDGWAAASGWDQRRQAMDEILSEAEAAGRPVLLATTSPIAAGAAKPAFANARDVKARVAALAPQPLTPARMGVLPGLEAALAESENPQIMWLSDGLDYGDAEGFAQNLQKIAKGGELTLFGENGDGGLMALMPPTAAERGLTVDIARAHAGTPTRGRLRALALNGRSLGEADFTFDADATSASASFELPLALRNQLARLEIADSRSPASSYLLDDRWRRKPVGLVSGAASALAQPLLSPLYYVERALGPYAELRPAPKGEEENAISSLLEGGLSVLVLADIGKLVPQDERRVGQWVEKGGVLLRFAGPRLAAADDGLIPVKLRRGGRALGGALSWSRPQTLNGFDEGSPFDGLDAPRDVVVKRQVLAEPEAGLEQRIWARLSDGTPLVTAEPRGNGMVILFHVPASPGWSNLPLSGLFVEMLRRVVDLSLGQVATGGNARAGETGANDRFDTLPPLRTFDGFARLSDPPADARPIDAGEFAATRIGPRHPPGLYGTETRFRALNVTHEGFALKALPALPSTIARAAYLSGEAVPLKPWALVAAIILLMLDSLAVMALSGRLGAGALRRTATRGGAALFLICVLAAGSRPAEAQGVNATPSAEATEAAKDQKPDKSAEDLQFALRAVRDTHLAYVLTGYGEVDTASRAGLRGLNEVLISRTALEPGEPIGIDIESDDLSFFPLIYWPVTGEAPVPSDKALARIDAYMKNGGTIVFDTRDNQQSLSGISAELLTPEARALRRILNQLDIPPLEQVPADHVLTKAFYLLQAFPGRWAGGPLWVEAEQREQETATDARAPRNPDGVSAIIIGSNDFAAAWAVDLQGKHMYPVVPGGPRQRELAYRTGVNIVIYALTGNYKADQVHVPALLERLGQ